MGLLPGPNFAAATCFEHNAEVGTATARTLLREAIGTVRDVMAEILKEEQNA